MDLKLFFSFLSLAFSTYNLAPGDVPRRDENAPVTYKEFCGLLSNMENNIKTTFDSKLIESDLKLRKIIEDKASQIEKENLENIKKSINELNARDNDLGGNSRCNNLNFIINSLLQVSNKSVKCNNCKGCKNCDICFYHLLLIFLSLLNEKDKNELQKTLSFFVQPNMFNAFGNQNFSNFNQSSNMFPSFLDFQQNDFGVNMGKNYLYNLLIRSIFDNKQDENSEYKRTIIPPIYKSIYGPTVQANNQTSTYEPTCFDQNVCPTIIQQETSVYSPKVNACKSYGPSPPSFVAPANSTRSCKNN